MERERRVAAIRKGQGERCSTTGERRRRGDAPKSDGESRTSLVDFPLHSSYNLPEMSHAASAPHNASIQPSQKVRGRPCVLSHFFWPMWDDTFNSPLVPAARGDSRVCVASHTLDPTNTVTLLLWTFVRRHFRVTVRVVRVIVTPTGRLSAVRPHGFDVLHSEPSAAFPQPFLLAREFGTTQKTKKNESFSSAAARGIDGHKTYIRHTGRESKS